MERPDFQVTSVVLGSADPRGLARFYQQLLGWDLVAEEGPADGAPPGDAWLMLRPPPEHRGVRALSFQYEPDHRPAVWPSKPGEQVMALHLDIAVRDLPAAVAWAEQAGARLADFQPQQDVRVLLDPAGNPFCLWLDA